MGKAFADTVLEQLGYYGKRPKDVWNDVRNDWGEVALRRIYAALRILVAEGKVERERVSGNVSYYRIASR